MLRKKQREVAERARRELEDMGVTVVQSPTVNQKTEVRAGNRGFATLDEQQLRQIASLGGRMAHEHGIAHEFTPEEARSAGRKGGEAVSRNREHMAAIGRRGGLARAKKKAGNSTPFRRQQITV